MSIFWLSFTDDERPRSEQFLGVAIVAAPHAHAALMRTRQLGIHPGGKADYHEVENGKWPETVMNRLLTIDDAYALGGISRSPPRFIVRLEGDAGSGMNKTLELIAKTFMSNKGYVVLPLRVDEPATLIVHWIGPVED